MSYAPYVLDPIKEYFQNSMHLIQSIINVFCIMGIVKMVSADKYMKNDVNIAYI